MANQPTKYRKFVVGAASAALVASAVAPVASAAEFKDTKGNTHEEAINALVEAGIVSGYPDGTFLPNKTLTRSDVVKFMGKWLVSLGYEVPTDYKTNPRFTDQTPQTNDELLQYSALVKDHGVFNGYENGSLGAAGDITRENMAIVLVRAFDAINETDLVAFVAEQEFKKDVTDLATAKAEARPYIDVLDYFDITNPAAPQFNPKSTTTRGQFASFLYKTSKVEAKAPVVTATKVESVSATNLKEVVVAFDGTVDEDSATEVANYSLKSGKTIKHVTLSEDKKTATITVVDKLSNNKTEALTVSNVIAGDKEINEKNIEFTVSDNKLPEVVSLKSLGTKAVKVNFSEPVEDLQQNNFTLDGKAYFGKIDMGVGNKSVILTPYSSSALAVGDHSLTVSGVKDYAGFISLNSKHDFTVEEDLVAPTITEASATLESVTLTFSEDVDASTVVASKVYWKSGDSKKAAADIVPLADNKFKFVFSTVNPDNSLPTGKVDIYVEGVKDYSGNEIAKDTKVTVTPEIDQTRPEVRKVVATDKDIIKVTFSKGLDEDSATNVNNYTVLNNDSKVISVKEVKIDPKDKNSVIVELYSNLSVGENTLTIKNVKDSTKLKNTMLDFTGKISRADQILPSFEYVVNTDDKRVVLKFDKKMDIESLADYSNYLVQIDNKLQKLNDNIADLEITQDGTVVTFTFADTYNGKKVKFSTADAASGDTHVNKLQVLGVKDVAGNYLEEFVDGENTFELNKSTEFDFGNVDSDYKGYVAELVDRKTVKVKFSTVINYQERNAFTSETHEIVDVQVNGSSTVTLKFKENIATDGSDLDLNVDFTRLVDIAGNKGKGETNKISKANLLDSVAPVVVGTPVTTNAGVITITYSEDLTDNKNVQALLNSDFTITRVSDNKKLDIRTGYTVAIVDDNKVEITLDDADAREVETAYRVTVDGAKYITDDSAKKNAIANYSFTTTKVKAGSTLDEESAAAEALAKAKVELQSAIDAVKLTIANTDKKTVAADDTVEVDAETYKVYVDETDATEVTKDETFVTVSDAQALVDAIEAAKTAKADSKATTTTVNDAKTKLEKAIETFSGKVKTGSKA